MKFYSSKPTASSFGTLVVGKTNDDSVGRFILHSKDRKNPKIRGKKWSLITNSHLQSSFGVNFAI